MWGSDRYIDSNDTTRHMPAFGGSVRTRGSVSAAVIRPTVNHEKQSVEHSVEAPSQADFASFAQVTSRVPKVTGPVTSLAKMLWRDSVDAQCGIARQATVYNSAFDHTFAPSIVANLYQNHPDAEGSANVSEAYWSLRRFGEGSSWYDNLRLNPGNGTLQHSTVFWAEEMELQGVTKKVFTVYFDGRGTPPGGQEADDRHAVIALLCVIKFYFGGSNVQIRLGFGNRLAQQNAVREVLKKYRAVGVLIEYARLRRDGRGIICTLQDRPARQFL